MNDICHPTYYHMSQLGCNDQVKLSTAFYVYMELCEVKRYWDVNYKYSEKLELFYLEAKKGKTREFETFIPWPAFRNLTLDLISDVIQELKKEKFTFVFKEGDTTSVYYSVCSGIVKPGAPEDTKVLKQKVEQKFMLEREINKNAANLYERALSLEEMDNKPKKEETNVEMLTSVGNATLESESNVCDDSAPIEKTQTIGAVSQNSESSNDKCEVKRIIDNQECESTDA